MKPEEQLAWFGKMAGGEAQGRLVFDLWRAASVWDDLIDGDVKVRGDDLHQAFWNLLITVPGNPFYRQYQDVLQPALAVAVAKWLAANTLYDQGHRDLAWFLRMGFVDVVVLCAFLGGGVLAAKGAAMEAWLFLKREEPLAQYLNPAVPEQEAPAAPKES